MFGSYLYSFIIAQVFGLFMVIMAVVMIGKAEYYRSLIANLASNGVVIHTCASLWLLMGLFLILIHNNWIYHPRILVTILAWLITIKSVLWLAAPELMVKWSKSLYSGAGYYVVMFVMAIFGVALMSKGFYFVLS